MIILNREEMRRAITRLAMEIVENNKGTEGLVLIGIRMRGSLLARRLQREIERLEQVSVPLGKLDIALQRDDALSIGCDVQFESSEISFAIDGKNVALVDDIMYKGRMVRAALCALASLGEAKTIKLYTLIDRGHRELPFRADAVGKSVPTSSEECVTVHFKETDGEDCVILTK